MPFLGSIGVVVAIVAAYSYLKRKALDTVGHVQASDMPQPQRIISLSLSGGTCLETSYRCREDGRSLHIRRLDSNVGVDTDIDHPDHNLFYGGPFQRTKYTVMKMLPCVASLTVRIKR